MLLHILLTLGLLAAACILFGFLGQANVERFEAFQLRLAARTHSRQHRGERR